MKEEQIVLCKYLEILIDKKLLPKQASGLEITLRVMKDIEIIKISVNKE